MAGNATLPKWLPDNRWAAALAVAVVLAYGRMWWAGFIWDDDEYVILNGCLRTLDGLRAIWLEPGSTPQYYPLTHTSFWLEYQLWRLNASCYHAVNVLLHAANAILLWCVLRQLAVPGAWLGAALFAAASGGGRDGGLDHGAKEHALGLLWARLSAGVAAVWIRSGGGGDRHAAAGAFAGRWLAIATALFVASLLCKTVTITLIGVVLVISWWKTGRLRAEILSAWRRWCASGCRWRWERSCSKRSTSGPRVTSGRWGRLIGSSWPAGRSCSTPRNSSGRRRCCSSTPVGRLGGPGMAVDVSRVRRRRVGWCVGRSRQDRSGAARSGSHLHRDAVSGPRVFRRLPVSIPRSSPTISNTTPPPLPWRGSPRLRRWPPPASPTTGCGGSCWEAGWCVLAWSPAAQTRMYVGVEPLYRRVLAHDPTSFIAANNLGTFSPGGATSPRPETRSKSAIRNARFDRQKSLALWNLCQVAMRTADHQMLLDRAREAHALVPTEASRAMLDLGLVPHRRGRRSREALMQEPVTAVDTRVEGADAADVRQLALVELAVARKDTEQAARHLDTLLKTSGSDWMWLQAGITYDGSASTTRPRRRSIRSAAIRCMAASSIRISV